MPPCMNNLYRYKISGEKMCFFVDMDNVVGPGSALECVFARTFNHYFLT